MSEPIIVIPGSLEQQQGYRAGVWGKHVNYECLRCAYKTVFEARMRGHIAEGKHPWGFEGRGTSNLHDGFGGDGKEPDNTTKLVY